MSKRVRMTGIASIDKHKVKGYTQNGISGYFHVDSRISLRTALVVTNVAKCIQRVTTRSMLPNYEM